MEEKMYSVSEAVRLIGVESHVLRYWEEELPIAINRTSQGHRIYSQENIDTFCQVKSLKEKGIQLKAIRVLLEEGGSVTYQVSETDTCAILPPEVKTDKLQNLEHILQQVITEIVDRQTEKMEQIIVQALRDEMEELYLQYWQCSVREAAASVETKKDRRITGFLQRINGRKRGS